MQQAVPFHFPHDSPQQSAAIQRLKFYFFRAAGQHQQGAHGIGHTGRGAQQPLHHRGETFSLRQPLQLQFKNLKAALHDG